MNAHHPNKRTERKSYNVLHQPCKNKPVWCAICDEDVRMIQAEKAATVCRCSRRKIYRWVEEGDLHFIETPSGDVLVCGRSLSMKMEELDSSTHKLNSDYETR